MKWSVFDDRERSFKLGLGQLKFLIHWVWVLPEVTPMQVPQMKAPQSLAKYRAAYLRAWARVRTHSNISLSLSFWALSFPDILSVLKTATFT